MDLQLAHQMARFAKASYQETPKTRRLFDDASLQVVVVGPTSALVVSTPRRLYVSVAGTDSLIDWTTDLLVTRIPLYGIVGEFHRGFTKDARKVYRPIRNQICRFPDKPVIMTGHSLGGAVTGILTAMLVSDGLSEAIESVHVWGSPRFASSQAGIALDQAVGDRFFRYVLPKDKIPHVPPAWFRWYKHVGELVVLSNGKALTGTAAHAAQALGRVRRWFSRRQHSIDRYIGAIGKALESEKSKSE